jgi:hypothetical protein
MNNFLILGLPRSRTAWLANFLTYDGLFCYHEGTNGCRSLEEYKNKLTPGRGDSNTGLGLFDVKRLFSDFNIVVIDSEPEKAIQFSKDVFGVMVEEQILMLKENLDAIDGLHISLEEINDNLREIWEYVTDIPFHEERAELLKTFNIQSQHPENMDFDAAQDFINDCYS